MSARLVKVRLEGLTKEYGREILIGPAAAELVRETYKLQFIDRIAVKGKTKPLDVYSVVGPIAEQREASLIAYLDSYERAQTASRKGSFETAAALFHDCLGHWPGDKVAALHLERCQLAGQTGTPLSETA